MRSYKPLLASLFMFPLLLFPFVSQTRETERKLPKDLPPILCLAKATALNSSESSGGAGAIQIEVLVPRVVAKRKGKVLPKRKSPKMKVKVSTEVLVLTLDPHSPSQLPGSKVLDLKGKPVSFERLLKVLRTPKPILLSATGRPVDPFYLSVIRRQTMVILLGPRDGAPRLDLFPKTQEGL